MFKDITKIIIKSGKGGNGHVSFRREKYVPNGGPDGGDGGNGGDVVFIVDEGMNSLGHFNYKKTYSAGNGEEGGKRRCHGKNGKDIILKVPQGTIIREADTNKIIKDMSETDGSFVALKGGKGGLGNMHFATAAMQTPRYAKPGEESKELEIILELKLIADVGLVGLPNAGKSSFLAKVTNATPKIAEYPFTTINPNLGMVNLGMGVGFLIADIPGIIEGAADGIGLGHDFLKHIERNRLLLHLVDISSQNIEEICRNIDSINNELNRFSENLANKMTLLVLNKIDTMSEDIAKKITNTIKEKYPNNEIHAISTISGEGVKHLIDRTNELLQEIPKNIMIFEPEFDINELSSNEDLGFQIEKIQDKNGVKFIVTGSKIDKMLGYTNLESDKGFHFFQNFIKNIGVEDKLKEMNISNGDTVDIGGIEFEYYE